MSKKIGGGRKAVAKKGAAASTSGTGFIRKRNARRDTVKGAIFLIIGAVLVTSAGFASASSSSSGSSVAADFTVLAGAGVTCTDTTIVGDVGAGTLVTQTNCVITGSAHDADASYKAAYKAFVASYNRLANVSCDSVLTGTLADVILSPGVYCFDAAATLTGTLTLNGSSSSVWIFKIGTSGTGALTGTSFVVNMAGGGQSCNVFWWVAEAATLTDSDFAGNILAGAAITITRGTFDGDAFAQAAVTMTGTALVGCAGGVGTVCKGDHKDSDKGKKGEGRSGDSCKDNDKDHDDDDHHGHDGGKDDDHDSHGDKGHDGDRDNGCKRD